MPLLNAEELTDLKLLMLKDLEKTLKIVYEHQYRNILSKIVSNNKRFTKKPLPLDVSEKICRYNSLAIGLTSYLANLFDVFGESAVLNAKKTFEDNGLKWGKKLRKKLLLQDDISDIRFAIKNLYIDVPEIDYIEITDTNFIWYLSKMSHSSASDDFTRFHPGFYAIKTAWLHYFIKFFAPQTICTFEKISSNDDVTITNIEIKETV
jgi:hypothetical protein